jgi:hypothetical protein
MSTSARSPLSGTRRRVSRTAESEGTRSDQTILTIVHLASSTNYADRPVETRLVHIRDISPADEWAWNALAERAIEPNPYFEPTPLLLAYRHFEGFSKTRILIAQEGTDFMGVLPIIGVERSRIPPRMTMTTRGHPTAINGLCTPLVDPTCVDQTIGVLLGGLRDGAKRGELPGILSFKRLNSGGPVADSLRRVSEALDFPFFTKETWVRGVVSRSGKWENPLSSSRRRDIERRRRGLARDAGVDVTVVDRTNDEDATADFLRLEASGWKGRDHGSAFARDPQKVMWFQEWCAHWRAKGRLWVLALNLGEDSIAIQQCIRAGNGLIMFRVAHDPEYGRYGPGAMLLASLMEKLFAETDAQWIDSCTDPSNEFFLAMLPERRSSSVFLIGTGGKLDRTFVSAMPAMTKLMESQRLLRDRLAAVRTPPSPAGPAKNPPS